MHRVTLHPDARSVEVRHGERLLGAAWKSGVGIKSVCGGRGKCGSCIVQIDAAAPGALSPPGEVEAGLLPPHPSGGCYRLACLCEVHGDLTISVPPESQAVRSAPRKPYTVTAVAARPLASRVVLDVEGAHAAPPRALATRIAEAAAKALNRKAVELPLPVMADFARRPGFDALREVTATVYRERRLIQLLPGRRTRSCGIAVDIGTTSFVVFLCDLAGGEILAMRTASNPQAIYGEDVISRMTHIQQDAALLPAMRSLLVDDINRLLAEACAECGVEQDDIVDAVLVGNPTMQHILLGLNPESLGRGPYLPVWSQGVDVPARELGLDIAPHANAFVFPMVSGYIGGDTLAALLTRGADFYRGTQLLIDVGTNGEVVLVRDGQLFATSCATGPVYEGAHIRCGVRAAPGAVERVWVDARRSIRWAAIPAAERAGDEASGRGDRRPIGLCGSGVISSVAAAVGAGLVGTDGALAGAASHPQLRANAEGRSEALVLVDAAYTRTGRDIVLTQQDVRAVQLGKSALRAGIEMLLAHGGATRLDRIHLAGTFGNHLQPEDILAIGMVPPLPVQHIRSIGNAAGDGARMALFNRHHRQRVVALARKLSVLELSGRAEFQDLFVTHTELAPIATEMANPLTQTAMTPRPTVVISCSVLSELLGKRLPAEMPVTWMDITLHNTPKKLANALQEHIDAIAEPSTVVVGYGLCGNGLVGVKSGPHTLIIPRTHDCVAIFLGSHQRYVQRFFANANTYYLTKGWLDAKDEPLTDYLDYVRDYDEETADYLVEMKYKHYRRLCMVGFSQEELDGCRADAMKVADFCKQRFGMEYEETIGTTELIEALIRMPERLDTPDEEFVVVQPGGEITQEMFMRAGEGAPQPMGRKDD